MKVEFTIHAAPSLLTMQSGSYKVDSILTKHEIILIPRIFTRARLRDSFVCWPGSCETPLNKAGHTKLMTSAQYADINQQ